MPKILPLNAEHVEAAVTRLTHLLKLNMRDVDSRKAALDDLTVLASAWRASRPSPPSEPSSTLEQLAGSLKVKPLTIEQRVHAALDELDVQFEGFLLILPLGHGPSSKYGVLTNKLEPGTQHFEEIRKLARSWVDDPSRYK